MNEKAVAVEASIDLDILVQEQLFDVAQLLASCSVNNETGAVASFIGQVRASEPTAGKRESLQAMQIEHYPGMTESVAENICRDAAERWPYQKCIVRHRVGKLAVGEPIVLVIVASQHRDNAFAACEFIMDKLKSEVPFWKKAIFDHSERWIEAKASDGERSARWD